ncbi:MAG: exosortase/archaeosortase family protein [Phycisphaerales bacterium JB059]
MTTSASPTRAEPTKEVAPARLLGVFTPAGLTMTLVLTVAFVTLFYRWFLRQHLHSYHAVEDWGHAYVIPLISLYIIWQSREAISKIRPEVFWPGLAPFLLGIMTYFAGVVTIRNHMVQGFAIVLTVFGLTLLMTGPRLMKYLFIPIAYLVFAVTISESIMLSITFKLQMIASKGAYILLNLIGQPFDWFSVEIDGNRLDILYKTQIIPMNVAEACSGMRMVVAFLALAVAVALLACGQWWQRTALLLLAAPVAILMNVLRVTVLGLVLLANPDLASGDAHTVIGTLLLFPSLLLFLGIVWALNRVYRPTGEDS